MGRWARFAIGLALLAGVVGMLHVAGDRMPGAAGDLLAQNRAQDREVYAYFYSDLGYIGEFLDDHGGLYGKTALRRALAKVESAE